jgi:hypothetical protein
MHRRERRSSAVPNAAGLRSEAKLRCFNLGPLTAFAGAFLFLGAAGASAANWVPVTSHSRGTILVDTDSVQRTGNRVLVMIELKLSAADARGVLYEVDQWDFDCDGMTVATLRTQQFGSGGRSLGPESPPSYYPERTAIPPESTGFEVYRVVCR